MTLGGSTLALNAGSSSLKFALFDIDFAPQLRGEIENIDTKPCLRAVNAAGAALPDQHWPNGAADFATILRDLLAYLDVHGGGDRIACAGHRIVHGGMDHVAPTRINGDLVSALDALTPLDPLHMPHCLAPVRALALARPNLPQVACFDTAFHHAMPAVAQTVPVSQAIRDLGVRRYGFHGLSYEFIATRLTIEAPVLARGRVVIAHLGAGASLCAMHGGTSQATTMGFSTLDGLMMGTRCGSIDPGVILFLMRQGRSMGEIEDLLYHHSGLLGVSGISADMRVLLSSDDPRRCCDRPVYVSHRGRSVRYDQRAGRDRRLGIYGRYWRTQRSDPRQNMRAAALARLADR